MAYAVGDSVYMECGAYGRYRVLAGIITKVTKSGQITAEFGERWSGDGSKRLRRFTNRGYEIGGHKYHAAYLITEEKYLRLKVRSDTQDLCEHWTKVLQTNRTPACVTDMENCIAELIAIKDKMAALSTTME